MASANGSKICNSALCTLQMGSNTQLCHAALPKVYRYATALCHTRHSAKRIQPYHPALCRTDPNIPPCTLPNVSNHATLHTTNVSTHPALHSANRIQTHHPPLCQPDPNTPRHTSARRQTAPTPPPSAPPQPRTPPERTPNRPVRPPCRPAALPPGTLSANPISPAIQLGNSATRHSANPHATLPLHPATPPRHPRSTIRNPAHPLRPPLRPPARPERAPARGCGHRHAAGQGHGQGRAARRPAAHQSRHARAT
jgi:hypothetical protein